MAKVKIKEKIKEASVYHKYRILRFKLNLTPRYQNIIDFIKHYFGGLINRMDDHHVFLLAGGLSFSIFICIIPFALIVFAVVGNILNSEYMQFQVNGLIDTIIPYHQYSEFVKRIIFTRINEVIEYKNLAGIIGGFGLLFAASGLFSSMRTILNTVLDSKTDEHFILAKLKDFALVIMVILIFFITTILMPFVDILRQKADQFQSLHFLYSGIFEHVVFSLLSLVLVFILFSILYFAVPKKKLGKKATLLSALFAALLWETAKQLFGYYIYHFSSLGKIYGTYVLFVVVAFWIYYSSIVFIVGAEIGKLYSDRMYAINKGEEIIEEE
jgi:membrane protein